MAVLELENIVKRYYHVTALEDVSLSIEEGNIYGILGPNGAGKTTLLRIITQIILPDKGEVRFMGRPLSRDDISYFGYLPEERGLYRGMKAGEEVIYLAQLKGLSRSEARKKAREWFEKYEITSWWDRKIEELSKGMQQKIQFIVTVLHSPRVVIFDEPFSGFDPINVNLLKQDILELKQQRTTIIFASHNMASVEELCDAITLLNNGHNVLTGKVHDVRMKFRENIFYVEFKGDPNDLYTALKVPFQVESLESKQDIYVAHLRFNESVMPNEVLSMLIPKLTVMAFKEVLPGVLDVFFKTVRQTMLK